MRVMMMHRTSPHWEAGATPSPELCARVGKLLAEMAEAGVLLAGEGLRASSQGVRLRFSGGRRTVTPGPFQGSNELPAGFAILRVSSLDEAVEWATRFGQVVGDVEIDVRPVTEPWDIGMAPRPEGLTTRRYMLMHKATPASEAGVPPTRELLAGTRRLTEEMTRAGVLLAVEALEPSSRGARLRSEGGSHRVIDGPFAESKELVAGYVILNVPSLREALAWAPRYAAEIECPGLDLRPLSERP